MIVYHEKLLRCVVSTVLGLQLESLLYSLEMGVVAQCALSLM